MASDDGCPPPTTTESVSAAGRSDGREKWTDFILAHRRLPQEEIDFILAWEKVWKEYLEKGVYEVDDAYIAGRVEVDKQIKDAWAKMMAELDLHDSDFADKPGEIEDDDDDDFFGKPAPDAEGKEAAKAA